MAVPIRLVIESNPIYTWGRVLVNGNIYAHHPAKTDNPDQVTMMIEEAEHSYCCACTVLDFAGVTYHAEIQDRRKGK